MPKKAVIILSGGADSTTCAAIAKAEGYELYALSFDYGQRHKIELEFASRVAKKYCKTHKIISFDMSPLTIGGSALTDTHIEVPKDEITDDIPVTYVPARNTIFLSFALAFAEVTGADTLIYGANQIDYSNYPDCRDKYINSFEKMANLASKAGVEGTINFKIYTPLINMTKTEIIAKGLELGVDYNNTFSCYDPQNDRHCGHCASCLFRNEAMIANNLTTSNNQISECYDAEKEKYCGICPTCLNTNETIQESSIKLA